MRAPGSLAVALVLLCCAHPARAFDCVARASDRFKSGDEEAAVAAVERGARNGDARCKFVLGMWSLTGAKAEQNPKEGVRLLKAAANEGLPVAQSTLGLLYASGLVVAKNEERAARLYRKAAEYGDPLGQTALALARFRGVGVEQDRVDAYHWMSIAARQGDERARAYLPAIESALTPSELQLAQASAAEFRAKQKKGGRPPSRKEVLSVIGLNRPPGEIERFFGLGGGVER